MCDGCKYLLQIVLRKNKKYFRKKIQSEQRRSRKLVRRTFNLMHRRQVYFTILVFTIIRKDFIDDSIDY